MFNTKLIKRLKRIILNQEQVVKDLKQENSNIIAGKGRLYDEISKLKQDTLDSLGINKDCEYEVEEKNFLAELHENEGFKSYIYVRDVEILRDITNATAKRDFQTIVELNGRRIELLRMAVQAEKEYKEKKDKKPVKK